MNARSSMANGLACCREMGHSNAQYCEPSIYFLFQWFYFEFQQLYSQWQESKDTNIKPVTVKEV